MNEIASLDRPYQNAALWSALVSLPLKILYAAISAADYFFLAALAAMLFRPPDLKSVPIDRIAFVMLLVIGAARVLFYRERVRLYSITWPLLALLLLGLWGVLAQPYDAQAWSIFAAKWVVPFACFYLAGVIFRDENSLRKLEWFSIITLVYLALTSVFFLFGIRNLIFPGFILDESIGIHADRARGPFLQAVANGVSLNILGLVALHSFDRGRLRGLLGFLLVALTPMALLATKTRAVWLSGAVSVLVLLLPWYGKRLRLLAVSVLVAGFLGVCALLLLQDDSRDMSARLGDRSPVEFRLDMYRAGWQMFTEKPLTGWGSDADVQPEIAKRISNFHLDYFIFHNTYLELAVQRGVIGLGLYAWLVVCLFRLGQKQRWQQDGAGFLGSHFRPLWPLILCVFLLNASAVVMNYQFLNGYLFSIAGILAARRNCAQGGEILVPAAARNV